MPAIDAYLKAAAGRAARQMILKADQKPTMIFQNGITPVGHPIPDGQIRMAMLEIIPPELKPGFEESGKVSFIYQTSEFCYAVMSRRVEGRLEVAFTNRSPSSAAPPAPPPVSVSPPAPVGAGASAFVELSEAPEAEAPFLAPAHEMVAHPGATDLPRSRPPTFGQAAVVGEAFENMGPLSETMAPPSAPSPIRTAPAPHAGGEAAPCVPVSAKPEKPATLPLGLRFPPKAPSGRPARLDRMLGHMVDLKSSDLHLCSGRRPRYRIDGDLREMPEDPTMETGTLFDLLFEVVDEAQRIDFELEGACDFAYEVPGKARFRFNIFKDMRGLSASIRQIPSKILSADDLNLPPAIRALANLSKGLVLVTGPTGSGKSTTLAAIVDQVNRTRADHIITIENPIEFVHPDKKCLVHQREVGRHTAGFKDALRDALRQDPDIVLVGELRDLETISTALETASTGHLVFGTLHTTTATATINRIIEIFPADEQSHVRYLLAESLKAVVAQTLLKKKGGGRVAALEVLIVNSSVANLIREQKTHQILNIMQTGKGLGMQLLNEELVRHVKSGLVEPGEAYHKCVDRAELIKMFEKAAIPFEVPTGAVET